MIPSYNELIHEVLTKGHKVTVRGLPTTEMIGVQVQLEAGETIARKGYNQALGWMELLQILAGSFNPEALRIVAPKARHDLFTPQMAYGPRLKDQLPVVVDLLKKDPTTRRAVVYLARQEELAAGVETPCTSSIQFLYRGGMLHGVVSMRSWDLVKGLTYDIVMFGGLVQAVARAIGTVGGQVVIMAGSAHIYDSDLPVAGVEGPVFSIGIPFPLTWRGIVWQAEDYIVSLPEWISRRRPDGITSL